MKTLPSNLSAGIGDSFRIGTIEKSGKIEILSIFLIDFIG